MSSNIQQMLQDGIEAAKRGDNETARKLLHDVTRRSPNNEMAWIWLATCVPTLRERRNCLQRVVEINPYNNRAKEALAKLADLDPDEANTPIERTTRRYIPTDDEDESNTAVLLFGLFIVIILVGGYILLRNLSGEDEPITPTIQIAINETSSNDSSLSSVATSPPSPTPLPPTATQFSVLVTAPMLDNLPATFTRTPLPTIIFTPTPTVTPLPLAGVNVLYTTQEERDSLFNLYQLGDIGEERQLLLPDIRDFALSPTDSQLVFTREDENGNSKLFVASLENPNNAQQLGTDEMGESFHSPQISTNGQRVAFVVKTGEDENVWMYNFRNNAFTQLTTHEGADRDPAWSPDNVTLAFASDRQSPGFLEIYSLDIRQRTDSGLFSIQRLTNSIGSSFEPSWSPDGTRITYVNDRSGDNDIYIMDADGQRPFLLTFDDNNATDLSPRFTPQGNFVLFVSNRDIGRFALFLVDLKGEQVIPVTVNMNFVDSLTFQPE